MATLTAKLWSITPFGVTTSITIHNAGAGTSELLIRASTNTAYQWTYRYTNTGGDSYVYKTDTFLHNEDVFGQFEPEDIMHVSMMVGRIVEEGAYRPMGYRPAPIAA